jgi:phosphoribosyl-AMP cyclohydrolase
MNIEETNRAQLDFLKLAKVNSCGENLLPAVAQNVDNGEVLLIGYVNKQALETAFKQRKATFWSTSRNELWIKGETSGDFLELIEVRVNCEQNSILYRVRLAGKGSCHTKDDQGQCRSNCFYRRLTANDHLEFI